MFLFAGRILANMDLFASTHSIDLFYILNAKKEFFGQKITDCDGSFQFRGKNYFLDAHAPP